MEPHVVGAQHDSSITVSVAPVFRERIVIPVGQAWLAEGRRKVERVRIRRVAVVPVGERPIGRPTELCDRLAYRGLEGCQIPAMPRQEVPRLVLALLPELVS